jgi:hypothetical protein
MIDFEKYGLDEESLKTYWTGTGKNLNREALRNLIASRLKDGIDSGLRDHRTYWAVDLAYDTPFNQTSYTLMRHLVCRKYQDTKEVYDAFNKWGLSTDDIVKTSIGPDGKPRAVINVPVMYKLLIPLVKCYTTIRQAKLFNDRNQNPLFKFEPTHFTLKSRVIGDVITDVVHRIASEYGYPQILRQAILQTLRYGICLMFPQEEWHSEKVPDGETGEKTLREGLRYNLPHPTRMAYDPSHRLSTVNTDTGISWALYWQVDTYSNVNNNEKYWNRDKIPYGRNIKQHWPTYFEEVYPCTMSYPELLSTKSGAGESDRENKIAFYQSSADEDKAVTRTEYFMKLIPKDYGMGTYKYPIWMRFVVASDDTVMWCAPVPYCPIIFMGYDFDDMRARNAGLGLEILPFEDALSNVLSQWILSVKQNLSRCVFYDTNQVDAAALENVENLGQRRFQGVPFIPYDSRKQQVAGTNPRDSFVSINFPEHNTEQIAALLNSVLSLLERVLVLSSHEIGQASSHEQTAEETRVIAGNTSTRVTFTGTFIDDGIDAWKRQLYLAARAYMDDDVTSQISMDNPDTEKVLKDLGFEVEEETEKARMVDAQIKVPIKAKMSALTLDSFINVTRDGEDRVNNANIAQSGMQLLQVALNNPITAAAIGPKQALDLITQFAVLAGLPRDFRLKVAEQAAQAEQQDPEQAMEGVQQLVMQAAQEVQASTLKTVNDQMITPIVQKMDQMEGAVVQTAEKTMQHEQILSGILDKMGELQQVLTQALAPPPVPEVPQMAAPMNDPGIAPTSLVP